MSKQKEAQSNKVAVVAQEKTQLPATELNSSEVDLMVSKAKYDIDAILSDETPQQKVKTEPSYFPGETAVEGDVLTAVLIGFTMIEDKKGEQYEAAVLLGKGKETFICSSKKAVGKLKVVDIGQKVELAYLGEKKASDTGFMYHNIVVSYFEKK